VQFIALMLGGIICLTSAFVDILVYFFNPTIHRTPNNDKKAKGAS
jgi:hypothetical protein